MKRKRRSREEIARLLEEYRSSGKTQQEFSDSTGIPLSTLTLWLRKDRRAPSTALVAIQAPPQSSGFLLRLGHAELEIPRDASVEELRRVAEAWLR